MKISNLIDKTKFSDLKRRNIYDFNILSIPKNCSLNKSFFSLAKVDQPDMRNRDLKYSVFYNINFYDKDISFNGSDLEGSIFFSDCNYVYFLPTYFENINFKNAMIINQNFYWNKFYNCDLTGAILIDDPSPYNGYDKIHNFEIKKCKINGLRLSPPGYDNAIEFIDCDCDNYDYIYDANPIRKEVELLIADLLKKTKGGK